MNNEYRVRDTGQHIEHWQLQDLFPNIYIGHAPTAAYLDPIGVDVVLPSDPPTVSATQVAERRGIELVDGQWRFAWLAVCLSAVSALLSFGLLALSGTPPLHAFGFTMLVGIAIVWLIAPCFSQIDQNPTLKKGQ